jgi:hypothetical protein
MTPFLPADVPPETIKRVLAEHMAERSNGTGDFAEKLRSMTVEQITEMVEAEATKEIYINDLYQVAVKRFLDNGPFAGVIHLSIKRRDKEVIHDWRHLQQIKNMIAGDELEAVEIYPPESQLIDSANQYHLWVLPPGYHMPFGFREGRMVDDSAAYGVGSAKQRAFGS